MLIFILSVGMPNLFGKQPPQKKGYPDHKFRYTKDGKMMIKTGKIFQPIETFFFDNGSCKLNQIQLESINRTIYAAKQKGLIVYLEGYAEDKGDADFNQQLSERRVKAIAAYLEKGGVKPNQIRTICFGKVRYKKSATAQHNRRVIISVEAP